MAWFVIKEKCQVGVKRRDAGSDGRICTIIVSGVMAKLLMGTKSRQAPVSMAVSTSLFEMMANAVSQEVQTAGLIMGYS